jgi:large subunit ribosomal protein L25
MEAILEATARESFGKNEARRTRRDGKVPAVLYGEGKDATAISVEPRALLKILHSEAGANTLIQLKLAGQSADTRVLVKDFQLDPITHQVLHADFHRVALDKAIQVNVPITVKGVPHGVKQQGGVLEYVRREVVVSCLPLDIPEHIELTVDDLMLHQGIRLRDVATNSKWKAVTDLDAMLVHVIMPKAEEVAAPAEGTAATPTATVAAEPEVIKKGKKETEEGEAPAKAGAKEEKKK